MRGRYKKIKLILVYPMTTDRNFDEVIRELTAKHRVATVRLRALRQWGSLGIRHPDAPVNWRSKEKT